MDDRGMNAQIDDLLRSTRPDRYAAAERDWRTTAYAVVAGQLAPEDAQLIAAKILVDKRESQATKRANKVFRTVARTKAWPVDWMELTDEPISVDEDRICLRVATAEDLRRWAASERREASSDFSARNDACVGAEWMADEMASTGALTLFDALLLLGATQNVTAGAA